MDKITSLDLRLPGERDEKSFSAGRRKSSDVLNFFCKRGYHRVESNHVLSV